MEFNLREKETPTMVVYPFPTILIFIVKIVDLKGVFAREGQTKDQYYYNFKWWVSFGLSKNDQNQNCKKNINIYAQKHF